MDFFLNKQQRKLFSRKKGIGCRGISQIFGDNDYMHMNISIYPGREKPSLKAQMLKGLNMNGSHNAWLLSCSSPCLTCRSVHDLAGDCGV